MAIVDIRNFTRRASAGTSAILCLPYSTIASAVLPDKKQEWEISLVFAGTTRAQNLNKQLRDKSYIPNVLSYESGKNSGEIIICLPIVEKQAASYGLSYAHCVAFMFIHGLLHLKGLPHGTTMERHERTLLKRFTGAHLVYGTDPST